MFGEAVPELVRFVYGDAWTHAKDESGKFTICGKALLNGDGKPRQMQRPGAQVTCSACKRGTSSVNERKSKDD